MLKNTIYSIATLGLLAPLLLAQEPQQEVVSATNDATTTSVGIRPADTPQGRTSEPTSVEDELMPPVGTTINQYLGVKVEPVPELLALHLPIATQGVVVTSLEPQGLAARSGVSRGDIILSVDGWWLQEPRDLALAQPRRLLLIQRGLTRHLSLADTFPRMDQRVHPARSNSTSVTAVSFSSPHGVVALSGVNGQYKLEVRLPQPGGPGQTVRRNGTYDQILETVQQLPESLRMMILERLQ